MAYGSNYLLHKGHLYKTQLGSSTPNLSSRLERQRQRLPRQYEKISFQVSTEGIPIRSSRIGYLPVLTPRSPVIIESRAGGSDASSLLSPPASTRVQHNPDGTVVEVHADVLDQTFVQHSKPGARPPWKPDCFCPRCGIMREQWVERNRKPFRPFSRQRETTFMSLTAAASQTHRPDDFGERSNTRYHLQVPSHDHLGHYQPTQGQISPAISGANPTMQPTNPQSQTQAHQHSTGCTSTGHVTTEPQQTST